jgi:hypothetical protein
MAAKSRKIRKMNFWKDRENDVRPGFLAKRIERLNSQAASTIREKAGEMARE